MSIALITTSTKKKKKKRNVVYCCVIHETIYCCYFMNSDYYSPQQRDKFTDEKMFFPNLYNSHFPFFLRSFFIITKVNFEFFVKTHVLLTSMMKQETATGGVL